MVHGGAWAIPADERAAHLRGVDASLDIGMRLLAAGASALEIAVECVRAMEDDPAFDAGTGSHLTLDGVCELDALLMTGDLRAGSVAVLRRVKNPILAARAVLVDGRHAMLVGEGAERFYQSRGGQLIDPLDLVVPRELARSVDGPAPPGKGGSTVGAVVYDGRGDVASATSTGGTLHKLPGRVGDSPLIGCGGYADGSVGAVGSTGKGEAIMRVVLAKGVIDRMAAGLTPQAAADASIANLTRRTGAGAGCIAVSVAGEVGWAFSTPFLAVAASWVEASGARRRHVGLA